MKSITISGIEFEMTDERRKRVASALNETREKLSKELRYSEDLQHKDMVEFYRNHIAKLEAYLA